jgi:hypothetical protein
VTLQLLHLLRLRLLFVPCFVVLRDWGCCDHHLLPILLLLALGGGSRTVHCCVL